jgi:hypothetical protein
VDRIRHHRQALNEGGDFDKSPSAFFTNAAGFMEKGIVTHISPIRRYIPTFMRDIGMLYEMWAKYSLKCKKVFTKRK